MTICTENEALRDLSPDLVKREALRDRFSNSELLRRPVAVSKFKHDRIGLPTFDTGVLAEIRIE